MADADIARKIDEFRQDVRDDFADFRQDVRDDFAALNVRLAEFVLREVYRVEQEAMSRRVQRLEDKEASDRRWRLGLLAATIAAVAGALVTALTTHGGGH